MLVRSIVASTTIVLGLTGAALAQTAATPPTAPQSSAPVVTPQSGSTGAPNAATISNGNPADTVTTNSSAGGNAGQPSRAVPQGGGSNK
ncbi:hypothetical protein [Methylobacterium sp. SD21]|jgi:hypothetical protein|uniref:hypothetical protein n=1 Tax=Methylobacterium litchii TaxID=3138810 RepID=UPI00313C7B99